MHNIKKRLFALLMTLVMALGISASAFAAEPVDVTAEPTAATSEEATTRASKGDVIATNTTTIYGGSGILTVHLVSANFWADLTAVIGYTPDDGLIKCSVTTPDGEYIDLGTVSGTGAVSRSYELWYAPAGDYLFYFSSAIDQPFNVIGYIYD